MPVPRVSVEFVYPGFFLPTLGMHVFDVDFDGREIATRRGYLGKFTRQIVTRPGAHTVEIRMLNIVSRRRQHWSHSVELPGEGCYTITLAYDTMWAGAIAGSPWDVTVGGESSRVRSPSHDLADEYADVLESSAANQRLKDVLQQRKRGRERGFRAGAWVAAACALLAVSVYAASPSLRSRFTSTLGLSFISTLWLISQAVHARFTEQPRLVVLLRRFRRLTKGEMTIAFKLGAACQGLAAVVTVQDSSFRAPLPASRQVLDRVVLIPTALLTAVALTLIAHKLIPWLERWHYLILWLSLVVLLTWAGGQALRRLAVYGGGADWESAVKKLTAKVKHGGHGLSETVVLKMPDAHWKRGVLHLIKNADAIVLDLTSPSASLKWEAEQVFASLPPERVLLTWAAEKDTSDVTIPAPLRAELEAVVDPSLVSRCATLSYPAQQDDQIRSVVLDIVLPIRIAHALSGTPVNNTAV